MARWLEARSYYKGDDDADEYDDNDVMMVMATTVTMHGCFQQLLQPRNHQHAPLSLLVSFTVARRSDSSIAFLGLPPLFPLPPSSLVPPVLPTSEYDIIILSPHPLIPQNPASHLGFEHLIYSNTLNYLHVTFRRCLEDCIMDSAVRCRRARRAHSVCVDDAVVWTAM